MMIRRRAVRLVASVLACTTLVVLGTGCADDADSDSEALFEYVNDLRAERGAELWRSQDDQFFQAYLQNTRDDCESDFRRESTYERYVTEEGEEFAEDYRARLAVLCPEEAAALTAPAAGAATPTPSPTTDSSATTP